MQAYLFTLLAGILASTPEAAAPLPRRRPPAARGRPVAGPGVGRRARPVRAGRGGALLHRRYRRRRLRLGAGPGRGADQGRPRGLPGRAAYSAVRVLPRPGGLHQPAAERRGQPARSSAGAPRRRGRRAGCVEVAAALAVAEYAPASAVVDRLGSTTHISVLDAEGGACSVTCSIGTGSGVTVPGTGIHLNNMLGEDDLAPGGLGYARCRRPVAVGDGPDGRAVRRHRRAGGGLRRLQPDPQRAAAGRGQRRRSRHDPAAGRGRAAAARRAGPRLRRAGDRHRGPGRAGHQVLQFAAPNLFFGGCQAVRTHIHTPATWTGAADGRRDGAVVVA